MGILEDLQRKRQMGGRIMPSIDRVGSPSLMDIAKARTNSFMGYKPLSQDFSIGDIAKMGINVAPIAGDAIAIDDARREYDQGNYGMAALNAATVAPVAGGIIKGAMGLAKMAAPAIGSAAALYRMMNKGSSLAEPTGAIGRQRGVIGGAESISDILKTKYSTDKLSISEGDNTIALNNVVMSNKGRGEGSALMGDLVAIADQKGKRLILSPSKDFGATSMSRLKKFYEKFGFVDNTGKNKNFEISESMYRDPQLTMDEASRISRAKEMGFDTGNTVYHGTNKDIPAFDNSARGSLTKARSAQVAHWVAGNPYTAEGYAEMAGGKGVQDLINASKVAELSQDWPKADELMRKAEILEETQEQGQNILPLNIKGNFMEYDAEGQWMNQLEEGKLAELTSLAKNEGYDGIKMLNFVDEAGYGVDRPTTHYGIFDPSNIRSIFAKFDPTKKDSANILAGIGGTAIGLNLLRQKQEEGF